MAANHVGSLTVNVVANLSQYTEPLTQAERLTKKAMREMGIAVDEFGNYTDKAMKKAAEATKALDAQFDRMADSMQREIALYGETSRVAQMRYDLEKGALAGLNEAQKTALAESTRRLAAMESANAAFREQATEMERVNSLYLQQNAAMTKEIALYGETSRAAKIRYEIERGALATLTKDKQFKLLLDARALDAMDAEAEKAKQLAAATKQLDAQHDQLNQSMLAQLATYGQVTRVAKLRYDMERGALKGLTEAQKQASLQLAQQLDSLDKTSMGSFRNFKGVTAGLGYQLQDIAVQAQMGTNAFMILGQQGSQIASLFGPYGAVIGAVIAVAGALVGALVPSLFKTGDTAEEVAANVASLVAELNHLDYIQKKLVLKGQDYTIADATKKYKEQGEAIEKIRKEIETIHDMPLNTNSQLGGITGGFGTPAAGGTPQISTVNLLEDATRRLNAAEIARLATLKEIEKLQDPTGGQKELQKLRDEIELIGLTGEALHKKTAEQKGYVEGLGAEYVALNLLKDQKEKDAEADKKAAKDREEEAKRLKKEEENRLAAMEKLFKGLEREADLYGVTSRAAQAEYDILHDIVDIHGGIYGLEGKRYILANERIDQLEKEAQLNKVFNDEIDRNIKAQNDADKKAGKANAKALKDMEKQYDQFFERIDKVAADVWTNMLEGATSVFDGLKKLFISTLAEMAHAALTRPIVMRIKEVFTPSAGATPANGDTAKTGTSAIAAGGVYAAVALAVVAGVNIWNKNQAKKFEQMTAAFRQAEQSTGTLLGLANTKSDSIANALTELGNLSSDTLNVNHGMYQALIDIRTSLTGIASGFAKTLTGAGNTGIRVGTSVGKTPVAALYNTFGTTTKLEQLTKDYLNSEIGGFLQSVTTKVTSAIYSKKSKIIDSGIKIIGTTLGEILSSGVVEAFAYADVQTTKKFLGVTTSNKVKTQLEGLDDVLLGQLSDVFVNAGDALSQAADVFGLEFQNYIDKLIIDPQKLSLKGLEGDALVKEIESFFSSTLDNWAGVLVGGTEVLDKFQQIGEGAFETVIRLASELNTFNYYADALNLNFNLMGFAAVEASQAIADAAGGFDALGASLSEYYKNFFTDTERAAREMEALTKAMHNAGVEEIPATREAFRSLIEGIDLSTTEGQTLFATLIGLSGEFADLVKPIEDVTAATKTLAEQFKIALTALERAVDAERTKIETAHDAAMSAIEASLGKHRDLASALTNTLNSMTIQSEKLEQQSRKQAQAQLITANAISKAGGPLPDLDKLASALDVLARPSTDMFATFEDYARDFYVTQNALKELGDTAGTQVSTDEQMLKNQEDYFALEMSKLDQTLEYYQSQLDALEGIDNSVLTVAEAVARLEALLSGVAPAPLSATVTTTGVPGGGVSVTAESYGTSLVPTADKSFADMLTELRTLREGLEISQYAIAKNTSQSITLLQRWETDGLPPEREEL